MPVEAIDVVVTSDNAVVPRVRFLSRHVGAVLGCRIDVDLVAGEREAVNGSEAVLAAVALAVWQARGFAPRWPASS